MENQGRLPRRERFHQRGLGCGVVLAVLALLLACGVFGFMFWWAANG